MPPDVSPLKEYCILVQDKSRFPEFRWYRGLMVRPNCITANAVAVGRFLFCGILRKISEREEKSGFRRSFFTCDTE